MVCSTSTSAVSNTSVANASFSCLARTTPPRLPLRLPTHKQPAPPPQPLPIHRQTPQPPQTSLPPLPIPMIRTMVTTITRPPPLLHRPHAHQSQDLSLPK